MKSFMSDHKLNPVEIKQIIKNGFLVFIGYALMTLPYSISSGYLKNYSDQTNFNASGIGFIYPQLTLIFFYGINCGMETKTSHLIGAGQN